MILASCDKCEVENQLHALIKTPVGLICSSCAADEIEYLKEELSNTIPTEDIERYRILMGEACLALIPTHSTLSFDLDIARMELERLIPEKDDVQSID